MKQLIFLLESKQTVFTLWDIAQITDFVHMQSVRNFARKMCVEGFLRSPYRGIYAKKEYNVYELWMKMKIPSYVSLDTVLFEEGIIFQVPWEVTLVSNDSRVKKTKQNTFSYHKIKDVILFDPQWIINKDWVPWACAERALCDLMYLKKWIVYVDDAGVLDLEYMEDLKNIYDNSTQNFISQFIVNARTTNT